jgi:hypothetical protein
MRALLIYAHFHPDNQVESYVLHTLRHFLAQGFDVIFASTSPVSPQSLWIRCWTICKPSSMPSASSPANGVDADRKLSRVFYLACCFLQQGNEEGDHHRHDWQGQADAPPRQECGERDREGHGPIEEYGGQVVERGAAGGAQVPPGGGQGDEAAAYEAELKRALFEQIKAAGCKGGYTRVTDVIRACRAEPLPWLDRSG